jgi:hypothetical protein
VMLSDLVGRRRLVAAGLAVDVPMSRPLQTSGGTVGTAPLVLVDLIAEEGNFCRMTSPMPYCRLGKSEALGHMLSRLEG